MASDADWLTSTLPISAQRQTCSVGIWIVLSSGKNNFGNQMASHYILGSERWSRIEWWLSNVPYSKHTSGVLNISSRIM